MPKFREKLAIFSGFKSLLLRHIAINELVNVINRFVNFFPKNRHFLHFFLYLQN